MEHTGEFEGMRGFSAVSEALSRSLEPGLAADRWL